MALVWPDSALPHFSESRNLADMGPRMIPIITAGTVNVSVYTVFRSMGTNRDWGRTGFAKVPCLLDFDGNHSIQDCKRAWNKVSIGTMGVGRYEYQPKTLITTLSSLRLRSGILGDESTAW